MKSTNQNKGGTCGNRLNFDRLDKEVLDALSPSQKTNIQKCPHFQPKRVQTTFCSSNQIGYQVPPPFIDQSESFHFGAASQEPCAHLTSDLVAIQLICKTHLLQRTILARLSSRHRRGTRVTAVVKHVIGGAMT